MTTGRAHESGICHQIEAEYKRLYVCSRDGGIGASDVPCNHRPKVIILGPKGGDLPAISMDMITSMEYTNLSVLSSQNKSTYL